MADQTKTDKSVPIWLDCDPGHDDAFAILMCAHHPSIDFLGISTVHGNAPLLKTTNNASSLLVAFGRTDVPIYPGAAKPFSRPAVHAPNIHGDSGLDGTDLMPPPQNPTQIPGKNISAVVAMYEAIMAQIAGTAWIVATGTLTNVALLLAVYPEVADHLAGISIMGGAFGDTLAGAGPGTASRIGNITPFAEFNIYCDPESAQAVMSNAGLKGRIIVIALDITHTVLATKQVLNQVLGSSTGATSPLRQMMHDLLVFFANTYATEFGISAGPPLHDPVAVAAVLHREGIEPEFNFEPEYNTGLADVVVVTDGLHGDSSQVGRTIKREHLKDHNSYIPLKMNVEAFWNSVDLCLSRAEKAGSMG